MNIDLTPILQALLGLLAALITYRLIPWIKARTTNEQQALIRALIKSGVYAAEQLYQGAGRGHEKLEYVREYLNSRGFDVNVTEIEAAVAEYINFPVADVIIEETKPPEAGDGDGENVIEE